MTIDWGNPGWWILAAALLSLLFGLGHTLVGLGKKLQTVSVLEKSVGNIEKAIQAIQKDIQAIWRRLPESTMSSDSPLRLTDLGNSISGDLGAPDWANETAKKVIAQITDKTPYGIQQFSFDYVRSEETDFPEELIAKMKDSAFRHGTQMKQVKNVLAIELRDVLLRLHGMEAAQ